jgi:AcrR family transcriptional regulator
MKAQAGRARRGAALTRKGAAASASEAGYHHGDLQEALIAAAEEILASEGIEGFTLREAARRAGVSPAAPAHHFGNAAGLLVAVGLRGYAELTEELRKAGAAAPSPLERLVAQGVAYVRFALKHPGRFELMFSNKRALAGDNRLKGAGHAAYDEMERALAALMGPGAEADIRLAAIAAWSLVHGFAKLALEGKFDQPKGERDREKIIRTTLRPMLDYLFSLRNRL